jgi:pimeloyl-ACP methyl ester carboxylesterase
MAEPSATPQRDSRVERHSIRSIDYAVHAWGEPGSATLVCLHGWGDSGASFQFLADELGDEWHVIAPDWRGFGRSSWSSGGYWFPDYLADLDVLLSIYTPDEPACVLGHSMGGNVAGLYAGIRPERIRAFVNVEGFGLEDSDPTQAPARYLAWMDRDAGRESFSSYTDFDALARRVLARSPRMHPVHARYVAECWAESRDGRVVLRADPRHRLPNPVLYRRAEADACWRRATAPVLLVGGADSSFREAGHRHDGAFDFDLPFPNRRKVEIPAAGHMLHFEVPAALAVETRDFLAKYV